MEPMSKEIVYVKIKRAAASNSERETLGGQGAVISSVCFWMQKSAGRKALLVFLIHQGAFVS